MVAGERAGVPEAGVAAPGSGTGAAAVEGGSEVAAPGNAKGAALAAAGEWAGVPEAGVAAPAPRGRAATEAADGVVEWAGAVLPARGKASPAHPGGYAAVDRLWTGEGAAAASEGGAKGYAGAWASSSTRIESSSSVVEVPSPCLIGSAGAGGSATDISGNCVESASSRTRCNVMPVPFSDGAWRNTTASPDTPTAPPENSSFSLTGLPTGSSFGGVTKTPRLAIPDASRERNSNLSLHLSFTRMMGSQSGGSEFTGSRPW